MKLKSASHWNIFVFCHQWKFMSDLQMSHEKMSDFASFLLFGLTVVIKLINVNFEIHWNTLIFFCKKRYDADLNMSQGKMSELV